MIARKLQVALAVTTGLCSPAFFASPAMAQSLVSSGDLVTAQNSAGDPNQITVTNPTSSTAEISVLAPVVVSNWNNFHVPNATTLNILNASAASKATLLARVITGNFSDIGGTINASNVNLWLLNQNGIIIGDNASISANSFFASTLAVTDADFFDFYQGTNNAGNGATTVNFSSPAGSYLIVGNNAQITTSAGPIVLLGGLGVANSGRLSAAGDVVIAAASNVSMTMAAGSPISMTIHQGISFAATTTVGGTVAGKNVLLAVATQTGVTNALLDVTGAVTATGAAATDRGIVLSAAGGTNIAVGGSLNSAKDVQIDAAGSISGTGTVTAAGRVNAISNGLVLGAINAGSNVALNGGATGVGTGSQDLTVSAGGSIGISTGARGRDIALNAGGTVNTGTLTARDDVVIRAGGGTSVGAITAGTTVNALAPIDVAGAADALAGATLTGSDVSLSAVGNLTTYGAINAVGTSGDVTLAATGAGSDLTVNANISAGSAGDISLTAADIINRGGSAILAGRNISLTAGDFAGGIFGAAALQETNNVNVTDTGGALFISAATGLSAANALSITTTNGDLSVGGVAAGGNITLGSSGNLTLTDTVNATGDTLTLNAGGDITQSAAFTAATLTGSAGGAVALGNVSNQITNVGPFTADRLFLYDQGGLNINGAIVVGTRDGTIATTGDLTVNAAVSGGNSITLNASGTGSDILLNGAVSGATVGLGAGGSISQTSAGTITADQAELWANGAVALASASNQIGQLLSSGGNGFSLNDVGGLTVAGDISGGTSGVSIDTSGALTVGGSISASNAPIALSGDSGIAVNAAVNAGTGNVDLTSLNGGITQSAAGIISAGTLTGSAGGAVVLDDANQLASLGAFEGTSVIVNDVGGLAITGLVDAGTGNATVSTSGGDLTISSTGTVSGADVVLSSDQDFHNNSGADAIAATGRWLVYSATPGGNTYGGLDSGNTAIWNATLATLAAGSVSGDRYVFAYQPTLTFTSDNDSKTYGDVLTGSTYTVTGFQGGIAGAFGGDTEEAFSGNPAFSSIGYAANADVAGGPYDITIAAGSLTSASGYAFAFNSSGKLTVDPKAITGVVVVNNKTYDGTTDATGGMTLNGVLDGDSVSGSATYAFGDKNAGTDKTVYISNGSLSGDDAGNYTLTIPATVMADILQKAITGTVSVGDKTYDGTTAATGSVTLSGVIDGDSVSGAANVAFADKNAGADKTVNVTDGSLSGDDAGNYTLTLPATVVADILQKAITGTVSVGDKTYDGTTAATGSVTLSGVIDGDSVNGNATFAFADKNAGTDKTVSVSNGSLSGDDAGNYSLTLPATAVADILQRAITGTVSVDDKTYDGTTAATGSMTLNGVVAGDNVSGGANFAFTDANAGAGKTVQVTGAALTGADAGNYTLTVSSTAMADILQRVLVIAADDASKVEGQADPSFGYTLAQGSLVGSDSLTGSLSRDPGEAPGLYDILQGSLSAGQNYAITFESGVLTITSAGPVTPPPPGPLPVAGIQPVRATPLPAQVRGPAKASSPIVLQPGIFCDPQQPCPAR